MIDNLESVYPLVITETFSTIATVNPVSSLVVAGLIQFENTTLTRPSVESTAFASIKSMSRFVIAM